MPGRKGKKDGKKNPPVGAKSPPKEAPWRTSTAKQLLVDDVTKGAVTEDDKWRDVYLMRPEYASTRVDLFSGRLASVLKQVAKEKISPVKEADPWAKSVAKKLLAQDIIDGNVTEEDHWNDVFSYRPEYAMTKHSLFYGRLTDLKKAIQSARGRAASDDDALKHDRCLFPVKSHNYRGEPRWEGSAAQAWLKVDIRNGIHKKMKPEMLHVTRRAYLHYPLNSFRQHIYQEVRCFKFHTWRNENGEQKATEWC